MYKRQASGAADTSSAATAEATGKKWVVATDTVFKPFEYTDASGDVYKRQASVYALRAAFGGCAPTRACGRSPSGEGLGVLCPTRGCLFVQLFRQYHHQQQHDKQRPGVELHRDILRQDAEKWR